MRDAVAAALALWSDVTRLTFTEVPVAENPEIVIRFVTGDHGDGATNAFDGPGGTLAHAFFPPPNGGAIAGDAHFDEAETWSVTVPVPLGSFDLVTVAAHEFGHSLGLAHSSVAGSLMFPTNSGPHRFLHADDREGIQSVYGLRVGGWEGLGGVLTSGPDASSWAAGRLDVFARGQDNGLWHLPFDNGGWGDWGSLGAVITSNPSAVSWASGRIDVFARGQDSGLWHLPFDNGGWGDWESLGGEITSGPNASSWAAGRLDVFARGQDNGLWHLPFDNGGWGDWESLGGVITADPSAVSWASGRIDVFARGQDNGLWHLPFDNGGWGDWESLGGEITSAPDPSSWAAGRLDVFARGQDNGLWHLPFDNSGWGDWESLGGELTSDPSAFSWASGRIDVFARGQDNALWHKFFDAVWGPSPPAHRLQRPPAAVGGCARPSPVCPRAP